MATIDQIAAGLIAFRDETYSRLTALDAKIDALGELETKIDADRVLYTNCVHCNVNGMIDGDPSSCTVCGGTGFRPYGKTGKT